MTEAQEQEALFEMAAYHPVTRDLLYAIPNDGKRSAREGARFKKRGLKPGVPDICLPISAGTKSALYIELKREHVPPNPPARATLEQREWIKKLNKAGNYACIAYGWKQAWDVITNYLEGRL